MTSFEFDYKVEGLAEIVAKCDSNTLFGEPVREFLENSTKYIQGEAQKRTPVDTGRLRGSITHEIDGSSVPLWGKVGTDVFYAPYVEFGTRAHFPPISGVQGWADRHGISAFSVALAISRAGTKAYNMFRDALEASKSTIEKFASDACRKIEEIWGR